jgi:hypothetical protein
MEARDSSERKVSQEELDNIVKSMYPHQREDWRLLVGDRSLVYAPLQRSGQIKMIKEKLDALETSLVFRIFNMDSAVNEIISDLETLKEIN